MFESRPSYSPGKHLDGLGVLLLCNLHSCVLPILIILQWGQLQAQLLSVRHHMHIHHWLILSSPVSAILDIPLANRHLENVMHWFQFVQYLYARRTKSYHQHLCCTVIQVNKNSQYVECSKKKLYECAKYRPMPISISFFSLIFLHQQCLSIIYATR